MLLSSFKKVQYLNQNNIEIKYMQKNDFSYFIISFY